MSSALAYLASREIQTTGRHGRLNGYCYHHVALYQSFYKQPAATMINLPDSKA